MIQLTPHMRIMVALEPVDFRKGIDGLAQLVREVLKAEPFSGIVFVFRNKRRTAAKLLVYDGQGFWLCQKRLSKGCFKHWPKDPTNASIDLRDLELQMLLSGANPLRANAAPEWRRIATTK